MIRPPSDGAEGDALIDYDVCSNWGNWCYVAGVGNDARGFRWFHVLDQAKRYDPDGHYVRHWLPELGGVSGRAVHAPWEVSRAELARGGVDLGTSYPEPIVDFDASIRSNERAFDAVARGEDRGPRTGRLRPYPSGAL